MTEKQKMTWVEQTAKTMKVSMEEHQKKMEAGQTNIRQFFQKRKTTTNT